MTEVMGQPRTWPWETRPPRGLAGPWGNPPSRWQGLCGVHSGGTQAHSSVKSSILSVKIQELLTSTTRSIIHLDKGQGLDFGGFFLLLFHSLTEQIVAAGVYSIQSSFLVSWQTEEHTQKDNFIAPCIIISRWCEETGTSEEMFPVTDATFISCSPALKMIVP